MTQYVAKLPVPIPSIPESQQVVQLTRQLLAAGKSPDHKQTTLLDDLVESAFMHPKCSTAADQETLFYTAAIEGSKTC
jgi:hypothetical protein